MTPATQVGFWHTGGATETHYFLKKIQKNFHRKVGVQTSVKEKKKRKEKKYLSTSREKENFSKDYQALFSTKQPSFPKRNSQEIHFSTKVKKHRKSFAKLVRSVFPKEENCLISKKEAKRNA